MEFAVHPAINAGLNALAGVLLVTGRILIRKGRETGHKRLMLSAFVVSAAFLVSYLAYHASRGGEPTRFSGAGPARILYLALLGSHTLLAAAVPFLAARTIWLGLKDLRARHRAWARVTFPIWLYVSVTGVLIYLILYHWSDSAALSPTQG